jgi:hypothetical protein
VLILLPFLTAGIAPVHHDTNAALERALVTQVRADVKAGWRVVEGYGWDAGVSLVKDGTVMRRSIVVEQDGDGGELMATATPVTDTPREDDFLTQSMLNGGVTLASGCGDWYLDHYIVVDRARGEAAGKLVADTLRTADDVEGAYHEGGVVTFVLEREQQGLQLVVELNDEDRIDRASVKRVRHVTDNGTYKRKNRMRQSLRGKTVTTIDTSGMSDSVALVVGAKRFEVDPDSDAFVAHPRDDDESGCGC